MSPPLTTAPSRPRRRAAQPGKRKQLPPDRRRLWWPLKQIKVSRNVVLCLFSPWWQPMLFLRSPALRDRAFQCCERRDGHAGRGRLPHDLNLRRGEGVGSVDEVAEGALQFQGFGGEGAGGLDGAGISASKDVAAPGRLQPACRDMPQSLSAVYIHLVFSTKHRRPLLRDAARRVALHALSSASRGPQSRRDCVLQPWVASRELPWGTWSSRRPTPMGLWPWTGRAGATTPPFVPFGIWPFVHNGTIRIV